MTIDEPKLVISILSSKTGESYLAKRLRRHNRQVPGARPVSSGEALQGILLDSHDDLYTL